MLGLLNRVKAAVAASRARRTPPPWLPNALTVLRLALALPVYVAGSLGVWLLAVGLYCLALITDAIDGRLARRYGTTSRFGRAFDSPADKLLVAVALVVLADQSRLIGVMAVAFLVREVPMMALRSLRQSSGDSLAEINDRLGRARFSLAHAGVVILLIPMENALGVTLAEVAVAISIAMGYATGVYYVVRDRAELLDAWRPGSPTGVSR